MALHPIIVNDGKSFHSKLGHGVARSMSEAGPMCPDECTLKGAGCYAEYGPTGMHGRRAAKMATDILEAVKKLPRNWLFRHNVSGDFFLKNEPNEEYIQDVKRMAVIRKDITFWGYTHGPKRLLKYGLNKLANLTINASCDTPQDIIAMHEAGMPTVTTVEPGGKPVIELDMYFIVVCPARKDNNVKCSDCKLCAKKDRVRTSRLTGETKPVTIGFEYHGSGKNKAAKAIAAKMAEEKRKEVN